MKPNRNLEDIRANTVNDCFYCNKGKDCAVCVWRNRLWQKKITWNCQRKDWQSYLQKRTMCLCISPTTHRHCSAMEVFVLTHSTTVSTAQDKCLGGIMFHTEIQTSITNRLCQYIKMIWCSAPKTSASWKTNAIGIGLVWRLKTTTFSMPLSFIQKRKSLMVVVIL